MIKAVLFDVGGVLTEGGNAGSVVAIYAKMYGLKPEAVVGLSLREDWMCGRLEADDFFAKLNALHPDRSPASKELFLEYSAPVFVRSEPVHALAAELRRAGLKTGIISDAVKFISEEHIRRGDYDGFDPLLLSWREGMTKTGRTVVPARTRQAATAGGRDTIHRRQVSMPGPRTPARHPHASSRIARANCARHARLAQNRE